jgi:2-polyprenyl-3-methyl-5-hydroxy-6-metoxy-1,4-benzoquinol methylase
MPTSQSAPITVPDPLTEPLRDTRYLVKLISTISGVAEEDVAEQLWREHQDIGCSVAAELKRKGIRPYEWSAELLDFYRETNSFLYETTVWNRSPEKNEMRRWIANYLAAKDGKPQRILTFGDGLGFDSLYLTQAGHQVDYHDVSADGGSFAARLFRDFNADVRILNNAEDVVDDTYDAVVCLDVLEHVPSPPELVNKLARAIRPGGNFIVHAPFWYVAPAVATHLRSNKKYSGDIAKLYAPCGLVPVDGQLFLNPLVLRKSGQRSAAETTSVTTRGGVPTAIRIGGMLLKTARICNWPHRLYVRWGYGKRWKPWPELNELRRT